MDVATSRTNIANLTQQLDEANKSLVTAQDNARLAADGAKATIADLTLQLEAVTKTANNKDIAAQANIDDLKLQIKLLDSELEESYNSLAKKEHEHKKAMQVAADAQESMKTIMEGTAKQQLKAVQDKAFTDVINAQIYSKTLLDSAKNEHDIAMHSSAIAHERNLFELNQLLVQEQDAARLAAEQTRITIETLMQNSATVNAAKLDVEGGFFTAQSEIARLNSTLEIYRNADLNSKHEIQSLKQDLSVAGSLITNLEEKLNSKQEITEVQK